MPARRPLEERFWEKVDKNGPTMPHMTTSCWMWSASKDGSGYGWIGLGNGSLGKAHRVSFEIHYGPLMEGECALHHCDNPPCVRPDHLFKGTQKDNADDREAKGRHPHPTGEAYWETRTLEQYPRGDQSGLRKHPERAPMGERNRHAVLTEELVKALRDEAETGVAYTVLAIKYGITASSIGKIVRGNTWAHLNGPVRLKAMKPTAKYIDGRKDNGRKKLTEEEVREIRKRWASGTISQSALARELGVTPQLIGQIVRKQIWASIEE
jgi:hypothetical protein